MVRAQLLLLLPCRYGFISLLYYSAIEQGISHYPGRWFVFSELRGNHNVSLYDGPMHRCSLQRRPLF
jgi:hypothetical protein